MINLRLAACGKVVTPPRKEQPLVTRDESKYVKMRRDVYFEEGGFISTSIYDGDAMEIGSVVYGPAVIEQRNTTIVVPPKASLQVNSYGDYMMELPE